MSCLIDPFPYGFPVVKSWTGGSLSLTARWSSVAISWSYLRFGFGRGWGTVGVQERQAFHLNSMYMQLIL